MNPLLSNFSTKYETIPFSKIANDQFIPALKFSIEEAKSEIKKIKNEKRDPDFYNVCEALDRVDRKINIISNTFFNLHSADTNDDRQKIAKEFSPILTTYSNDISLDLELFSKIKEVYENRSKIKLSAEQKTLLEKQYKGFVRNGALLDTEAKEELRKIDQKLSELSLTFGEHTLDERKEFSLYITNESELKGLPESVIEMAKLMATEKGRPEAWLFTLDFPSYMPFMTYLVNRELRKNMFFAYSSIACKQNIYDNRPIVLETVRLKNMRAKLLGYKNHASYVLEERMAETPERVENFLNELLKKAKPFAEREISELKEYAKKIDGITDLKRWDIGYYAEKLKKEKYNVDDEMLRPYFKLENVIDGAFKVAEKLYQLKFTEETEVDLYNSEVKVYKVTDKNGDFVGVFYADFFPRPGKRSGAWMTEFKGQHMSNGKNVRPHVSIVCNFTKSTTDRPSLLGLDEVLTLFHEFGHALHGLLSNVTYDSLSGPNVYWDFVELPSQIMENWVYEKDCLDIFARHYKTEEKIPEDLIKRIKSSVNFHEGRITLRQVGFSMLDMAWHSQNPENITNVEKFEQSILEKIEVLPIEQGTSVSCAFSHIFSGGYSAGYYSYKWAEVLDADAFMYFKEKGIFNHEVSTKFKENILSKGGSEHPMELYKRFRGQEPSIDALLKRSGLI